MKKIYFYILVLVLCCTTRVYAAEKSLDPDRAYNQGVDFYSKLDYNKSAESFLQSMNTQDEQLEQWAAYNLGSAFFGQGQKAEKNDPSAANQIYQKALNFFKRAIELDPEDKDAKYNYELTTKKIIEQKQKQKQQQDKKDKKDKQDKKKNQDQKEKDKQKQKDQKKDQSQQNKKQEENQQKGKSEQKKQSDKQKDKDKSSQQQQGNQRRQMTEQEAKMLLENFQQSEDKKKQMELHKAQQQPAQGIKGW